MTKYTLGAAAANSRTVLRFCLAQHFINITCDTSSFHTDYRVFNLLEIFHLVPRTADIGEIKLCCSVEGEKKIPRRWRLMIFINGQRK